MAELVTTGTWMVDATKREAFVEAGVRGMGELDARSGYAPALT